MTTKKKILITGVNGFIGSHIAADFRYNYNLYGLDTGPICSVPGIHQYSQMILPNADFEELIKFFLPDYCIHCAGSSSVPLSVAHPSIDFDSGPVSTFHVLEAIRKSGVPCCMVFISSAAVYGNVTELPIREDSVVQPISPYGYHKAMSEHILEEYNKIYGLPYIILRIFSAYGNGLRKQILWDACQRLIKHDPIFWGTGDQTRDFIHVQDIARLIAILIEQQQFNKIINVGSGEQIPIKRVIYLVADALQYPIEKIHFKGTEREGDPLKWEADVSQIRSIGFKNTISIEEGISGFVQWVKGLPPE